MAGMGELGDLLECFTGSTYHIDVGIHHSESNGRRICPIL